MRVAAGYLARPLNAQLLNNFLEAMAINWKAPHLAAPLARVCSNPDGTPPLFRLVSQQTRSIRAEFCTALAVAKANATLMQIYLQPDWLVQRIRLHAASQDCGCIGGAGTRLQ